MYTLIEKGMRKSAEDQFKEKNGFFKEYLAADDYKKLDTAINRGNTSLKK
jgi:hypothetical protein